jgi:hypothetical protein
MISFDQDVQSNRQRRPFRFEACWLTHKEFEPCVQNSWQGEDRQWNLKMKKLQCDLKAWNKEVFGWIHDKKRKLLKHLEWLDNKKRLSSNVRWDDEIRTTWLEYEQILVQEEILWFQKSRAKWLSFGDRNTKYFHGVTTIRRRRNRYDMLKDDDGRWINEAHQLEEHVSSYYIKMFEGENNYSPLGISGTFPPLAPNQVDDLAQDVSRLEIFETVKRFGNFKALEPGGFQGIFFKSQWNTVGEDFCSLILSIFEDPSKVKDINDTLISLIPKKDVVTCMKDFRPISLCNVTYKTVTKILAQRLRGCMEKLIGPWQSSFIPSRQSADNIIVAQEVFHSMRKKTGTVGWMAVKIDLEKAYDRLNWEFIKDTLIDVGLPEKMIDIIWHCVSSLKMKVLWNGEALQEFQPGRGIRQGDPLSPYLFVLCIERLFHLIGIAVNHDIWKPIKITRGGPTISHLAFADDLILFAEANTEQVQSMAAILDLFCSSSVQKVSKEKSRVFFSKNVGWHKKLELSNLLGIQATDDLGKYLGVPILHKRVTKDTYQFILDKVNQRLSTWKANTLSFAGRVTLAKSVIQALPSYVMQTVLLPVSICDEIDKRCRGFIWGDHEETRKPHLVNWTSLCYPKQLGGLGFRCMRKMNLAYMMRVSWRLCTQPQQLWSAVIRKKYNGGNLTLPSFNTTKSGSNLWRGLCTVWDDFKNLIIWRLGSGHEVSFWNDSWAPTALPLSNYVLNTLPRYESNHVVANYVDNVGLWNFSRISNYLPAHIIVNISTVPPPHPNNGVDAIA